MEELNYEIYGYTGHKWMRITEDGWNRTHFYARLPDGFDSRNVTHVETLWDDPNYCDNIKGYKIYWNNGDEINEFKATPNGGTSYWNNIEVLPYSDRNLYELIDPLVELARKLNIETDLDYVYTDYEPVRVRGLLGEISNSVDNKVRLLKLIEGKDIMSLLKQLDEEKVKNEKLTEQCTYKDNSIDVLLKELAEAENNLKKEKERVKELEERVALFESEREDYKTELLDKIKMVLSQ